MKTIFVLLLAGAACAQEPYSQLRATGPLSLAIAYRTTPDQRATLRQNMLSGGGVARFEGWKRDGILKEYHILFNSYIDSETYDMLALLTFDSYTAAGRWREVEKAFPGGLAGDTLKLITSAVTYSLDALRHSTSQTPAEPGQSVYFIIPYDYLIASDDYVKYLDTYVIPQVNGWISESVLAGYTIYLSRYSTSRPWGSLFVLEYRDQASFGLREATVAKVREKLKSNPAWLAASQSKQQVRVEKQTIIAEELLAR